jgi:hypothetical protein
VHKNEEYILAAFQAGSDGYVLKYAGHEELVSAIRTVLKGQPYLSPDVSAVVLEAYLEGQKGLSSQSPFRALTTRETEVLKLIAEGYKIGRLQTSSVSASRQWKDIEQFDEETDLHSGGPLTAFVENGLICFEQRL